MVFSIKKYNVMFYFFHILTRFHFFLNIDLIWFKKCPKSDIIFFNH